MGAMLETDPYGQVGMTHVALGPDLYGGTSGIALFLAQLHAATGDPAPGKVALGAVRQALSRLDARPDRNRLGLYGGRVGIGLAAARVGSLLGEWSLLERAAD